MGCGSSRAVAGDDAPMEKTVQVESDIDQPDTSEPITVVRSPPEPIPVAEPVSKDTDPKADEPKVDEPKVDEPTLSPSTPPAAAELSPAELTAEYDALKLKLEAKKEEFAEKSKRLTNLNSESQKLYDKVNIESDMIEKKKAELQKEIEENSDKIAVYAKKVLPTWIASVDHMTSKIYYINTVDKTTSWQQPKGFDGTFVVIDDETGFTAATKLPTPAESAAAQKQKSDPIAAAGTASAINHAASNDAAPTEMTKDHETADSKTETQDKPKNDISADTVTKEDEASKTSPAVEEKEKQEPASGEADESAKVLK